MKKSFLITVFFVLAVTFVSGLETAGLKPGDTVNEGIRIGGRVFEKTSEVVIIPAGKKGVVDMKDNSSWNTYLPEDSVYLTSDWKGVFIKDRKVTLSPFVMSQYEVTQELYEAVMGGHPNYFFCNPATSETQKLRPVEFIGHYEAVAFCNELTGKTMKASDVVYFSDEEMKEPYTIEDAKYFVTPYMDMTRKGYRLPTEAEWEYAARGGNPESKEWKNAFGSVNTKNNVMIYDGHNYLDKDDNLSTVGWYYGNASGKTHEVGLKEKNSLNLYDMLGNVCEWCWDWYEDNVETGDVVDPVGAASGSLRVYRGGGWGYYADNASVGTRYNTLETLFNYLGIRVCRSIK